MSLTASTIMGSIGGGTADVFFEGTCRNKTPNHPGRGGKIRTFTSVIWTSSSPSEDEKSPSPSESAMVDVEQSGKQTTNWSTPAQKSPPATGARGRWGERK